MTPTKDVLLNESLYLKHKKRLLWFTKDVFLYLNNRGT